MNMELVKAFWYCQMLILVSQMCLWTIENLSDKDGLKVFRELDEPLWLAGICCVFGCAAPLVLTVLSGSTQLNCAVIFAALWFAAFAMDTAHEWKKASQLIKIMLLAHLTVSLTHLIWIVNLKFSVI